MKIKVALVFASILMLQACGSKSGMMHSSVSVDKVEISSSIRV